MANNDFVTESDVRLLIQELVAIESAAREAQLNQEAETRQTEDNTLEQLITQEISERETQLRALQNSVNQSITRIDGNVAQLQALFNQRYDYTTQLISQLNASFETKMALLDSLIETINRNTQKIATIEGDETTEGSIAKALFDAKAYTDAKVTEILDGAPEMLDTLKELSDSLGGDNNFVTTVNQSIEEVKNTANANKEEIFNLLSQTLIKNKLISISNTDIQRGYILIEHVNIVKDSLVAFINRLGIFENEDFYLSEDNGQTKLIFQNSLLQNGNEALEEGDILRLKYWTL